MQPDGLTQWNNCPRRPAIVGIIIHCPIDPARNLHTADFQLSIKCSDRTISDQSVVQKYGKRLTNCATGQETEIKIEPPVELNNGDNYCIAVEARAWNYCCVVILSNYVWDATLILNSHIGYRREFLLSPLYHPEYVLYVWTDFSWMQHSWWKSQREFKRVQL